MTPKPTSLAIYVCGCQAETPPRKVYPGDRAYNVSSSANSVVLNCLARCLDAATQSTYILFLEWTWSQRDGSGAPFRARPRRDRPNLLQVDADTSRAGADLACEFVPSLHNEASQSAVYNHVVDASCWHCRRLFSTSAYGLGLLILLRQTPADPLEQSTKRSCTPGIPSRKGGAHLDTALRCYLASNVGHG